MTTIDGHSGEGHLDSTGPAVAPAEEETTHHVDYPAELVDVELELEQGYHTEIHKAHDTIDVEGYGGGFDLTRRATAPKLRVGGDKWFNLLW
ncbi:MAG: molybdopterin-dependent oxidoreductase, partial [Mycobacterium sp.]